MPTPSDVPPAVPLPTAREVEARFRWHERQASRWRAMHRWLLAEADAGGAPPATEETADAD